MLYGQLASVLSLTSGIFVAFFIFSILAIILAFRGDSIRRPRLFFWGVSFFLVGFGIPVILTCVSTMMGFTANEVPVFGEFGQPQRGAQSMSLVNAITVVSSLISPLAYLICFSLVLNSMMPAITNDKRRSPVPPQTPPRHPLDD